MCPLAATAFASAGIRFSYFYGISVGLSLVNLATLLWAFQFSYRVAEEGDTSAPSTLELEMTKRGDDGAAPGALESEVRPVRGLMHQTLTNRTMWIFSIFILV